MEHAKKLMLVEPNLHQRPTMKEKLLSGLDKEMEGILNSDLPDDVKVKHYGAALRKFITYDAPVSTVNSKKEMIITESDVLDSVPPAARHKAKRIMDYIKRSSSAQVSDKGELIVNQHPVAESNIVDLIEAALTRKKALKSQPAGWQEFAQSLKEANVPSSLIANEDIQSVISPALGAQRGRQGARISTPSPPPTPARKKKTSLGVLKRRRSASTKKIRPSNWESLTTL